MGAFLAASDISGLLEFLLDLYAIRDVRSFRLQVVSSLSKVVGSDITTYNEVNCAEQRNARVSYPSDALEFPDSHRIFDQHIPEHPLIGHYARTGDPRALKISDFLTRSQFHKAGLYADFYRPLGIEHQMAFTLPAPKPLVLGIALNRSRPDFSERDRLLLNLVRPHLIQGYRNAQAVTLLLRQAGLTTAALEPSERATILVDRRRRVSLMSDGVPQLLAKYFSDSSRAVPRLPEILERWIKQQEENLVGTEPPLVRTPLVVDQENSRLVARLLSEAEYSLLILEEQATMTERDISRSFGLTRREAEVLTWVAQGKTNADIASILAMSPRTVQKHLERIFQKLGVETRTAAAARILQMRKPDNRRYGFGSSIKAA